MAQITFGSNATPSLPNLDANFNELYAPINGVGGAAHRISGPGGTGGLVGSSYSILSVDRVGWVDSSRTTNNRVTDFLWAGGALYGRFINDAESAVGNWLQVVGGQAAGISQMSLTGNLMTWSNSAGAEHLRKDASGNFFVGTTSSTPNPGVFLGPGGNCAFGNNAGASGFGFHSFYRSTVAIGSITQSGTTAVLYNTTSDARLKKNIVPAPECGPTIDAMKVRSFDWKNADEHVDHGFIAQELVTVAPQAVKVGDAGEEVSDTWAIDPSKLVPLLVRELQSLRARVAALEA